MIDWPTTPQNFFLPVYTPRKRSRSCPRNFLDWRRDSLCKWFCTFHICLLEQAAQLLPTIKDNMRTHSRRKRVQTKSVVVIRQRWLDLNSQWAEMTLVKDGLNQLSRNQTGPSRKIALTNRLRSSPLTFGLTPTRFRSIFAIWFSLKMTISWWKNLIRQGLVAK